MSATFFALLGVACSDGVVGFAGARGGETSTTAIGSAGNASAVAIGAGTGAPGSGGTVPSDTLDASGGSGGSSIDMPDVGSAPADASRASYDSSAGDAGIEGDGMFTIAGPYKSAPEYARQAGVPQGKIVRFAIASSTIYPKAPSRQVAVYVPAQYKAGTPAAVMVFQDGTDFYGFDGSIPTVLDNLIAKGGIPPIVGVFAGNGGGDSVGSERGLEYDTVSGLYAEWADKELLPRVEMETKTRLPDQPVTFTHDPEGRGSMGGSSGGAASFSMAWWRPDLFRRVITFSGTYVAQVPAGSPFPHGAWIYHDIDPYDAAHPNGLIMAHCESGRGPKTTSDVEPCDTPLSKAACAAVAGCVWNDEGIKPIRIWHESGTNDNGAGDAPSSYRNFHLANQRMALSFQAKGYHFHYDDAVGAGHVDMGPLRQTLPAALTWLWRGYRALP